MSIQKKIIGILFAVLILLAIPLSVQGQTAYQRFRNILVTGEALFLNTLDFNGNKLTLDADGDTSITSDTDDQIDIEIGGADEYVLTASIIDINANQLDLDADNDTSITADTDDQIDIEIAAADEWVFTADQLDATLGQVVNIGAAGTDFNTVGGLNIAQDTESVGSLPTIVSTAFTYTAAAGGTGTIATVGANEVWFIHAVYINVTTSFTATGDDALLTIGDGNDANGLLDLVDAELQVAATEGTGAPAGWQGFMGTGVRGAYLAEGLGFIYDGTDTIDWLVDETSGETITSGAATVYVVYTRIQ